MIKLKNKIISFITHKDVLACLTLIIMLCITFSVGPRISPKAPAVMLLVTIVVTEIYLMCEAAKSWVNRRYRALEREEQREKQRKELSEEQREKQRKELSKEQLEAIKTSEEKHQKLEKEKHQKLSEQFGEILTRAGEKFIKEEQEYKERDEALIAEYEKNFDKSFIIIKNCSFNLEFFSFGMTKQAKQIHSTPGIGGSIDNICTTMNEVELPHFPRIIKKQDLINGINRWYFSPASYHSVQHAIDMFNLVKNDFEEEQYVEGLRKDYEFRKSKTEHSYFSITTPETIYLNESDWNSRNY